jgi:hypothetical protein
MSTSINPLTNKVGNIILIIKINIMKVTSLLNDYNKQETLISESVVEIQTNLHLAWKNLTT